MSALAGASKALPEALAPEAVRRALDDVLADERFHQNPISAWIGQLLKRIGEALFGSRGSGGDGSSLDLSMFVAILFWVVLGILLVALTTLIASRLRRRSRLPGDPDAQVPDAVHARVHELLDAARAAEAAGDLLRALRLFFFALVVGLGERGELRYRDAWTNRELFERGRPSADVRAKLAPIVGDLDRKSFGGEPVEAADVRRLEGLCAAWLPAASLPVAPATGAGR